MTLSGLFSGENALQGNYSKKQLEILKEALADGVLSEDEVNKHDGLFMAFASAEEIDDFINAIDKKHVIEKSEKRTNTDDLFK